MSAPAQPPKRVAIVGAGAAGMAAAYSLSRFPERFDVTVIEASAECGGVACTLEHDGSRINYGVQGGSPSAHQNTVELMRTVGIEVSDTRLDVSFGKDGYCWKNYEARPLQERLRAETRFFGFVLRWISRLEFLTIFLSIDFVLRVCRFSAEFRQRMVYPLVALFFGTGNQTPKVSAAVIARVFLDPSLAIFDYDPDYLLRQTPTNIAFDDLHAFYSALRAQIERNGRARFLTSTRVCSVERVAGLAQGAITLHVEAAPAAWRAGSEQFGGDDPLGALPSPTPRQKESVPDGGSDAARTLHFDELILACPADGALKLLGKGANLAERCVLGAVEYFDDLTVTHTDEDYMRAHNEVDGRAIYFIKTYDHDPQQLEMGFDLTAYQPTLRAARARGERIYQTIYLDRKRRDSWTIGELDRSKVIDCAWWSAFSHTYSHFRRVVPWVWTLQGRAHTWFAGSWTLFNTHDIAIASGLAAAHRLGAPYPFAHNALASATFDTVLNAAHLRWRRGARPAKGKGKAA